ncbi:class IV adenylate cyclase [bacterium]|nr:class IV adenylate cyclase [bacterium]
MPRNIEIKLKLKHAAQTQALIESIADGPSTELIQRDVFFNVSSGRLKLRIFPNRSAELIAYHRTDGMTPRQSTYSRVLIDDAEGLIHSLDTTIGIRGEILKRRLLYRIDRTRIHFDEVEGLGQFLELEVEMDESLDDRKGRKIAQNILSKLDLEDAEIIQVAYIDLLEN